MRILIDTNILISAMLNPNGTPYQAYLKAVTYPKSVKNTRDKCGVLSKIQ